MSDKDLRAFLEKTAQDTTLHSAMVTALSEAMVGFARKHGYECTVEECAAAISPVPPTREGELDDDALDAVAGGAAAQVLGRSINISHCQQSDGLDRRRLRG